MNVTVSAVLYRFWGQKHRFWHRIRNQRENLPWKPFFIRHFNVLLGWNSFKMSKSLKSGFLKKWLISTVYTVFKPKKIRSDAGFVFSVKIYPKKHVSYAFLSLFYSVTGLVGISKVQKSGGLAFLTTSQTEISGLFQRRTISSSSQVHSLKCTWITSSKTKWCDIPSFLIKIHPVAWPPTIFSNRRKPIQQLLLCTGNLRNSVSWSWWVILTEYLTIPDIFEKVRGNVTTEWRDSEYFCREKMVIRGRNRIGGRKIDKDHNFLTGEEEEYFSSNIFV